MSDVSKPTTRRTKEDIENFSRNYDRLFRKKIAVTFEHQHSQYSDVWYNYYSRFMDVRIVPIGDILRNDWGATTHLLNSLQEELFKTYGLILFADIDEIIVPDPEKYEDLGEYLNCVTKDVVRATGYNVVEQPGEKPLDTTKPILQQRQHWIHDELYNKYVILTKRQIYTSNHHILKDTTPDPDLILFHLRDADPKSAMERNAKIGANFDKEHLKWRQANSTKIPSKWLNTI